MSTGTVWTAARRAPGAFAIAAMVMVLQTSATSATSSAPCASGSAASSSRVTCQSGPPNPPQTAYDQLRARLGGDLARALTSEEHLTTALHQTSVSVQILTDQITREEAVITSLEDQIALLDTQISDTQDRIDTEKEQVASMAKAIYRQPDSLWMLIARTGNLHDALQATADLVVAGQRAHTLQARLEADLQKLQTDRTARQADLDRETTTMDGLQTSLGTLSDLLSEQGDISDQLADVIGQIQSAQNEMQDQPADVTAELAALLESEEQDLIQRSYQLAWSAAHVGVGLALLTHTLPSDKTIAGLTLIWPMNGARVTQLFGPSDFVLEPPLGPYKHFHTGIDIAAPFGTTVMAAAAGVVVAVGHSGIGYGNYVVVAHGGGIMTLYGHLLETDATVGDKVRQGQRIGLEGSTGWSTGPHVHFELRLNDAVIDPMPYLPVLGG